MWAGLWKGASEIKGTSFFIAAKSRNMLDGIKTNPQEFSAFSKKSYILSKTTLFWVLGFRV